MTRPETTNPLVLAWLGDALCHEYVRERLVRSTDCKVDELQRRSKRYVSAVAQARAFDRLVPEFAEAERDAARRARNARAGHNAKNASVEEYRKATALEAVFGMLRLVGDEERLTELLEMFCGICEETKR